MRFSVGALVLLFTMWWLLPVQSAPVPTNEKLTFVAEWRLIHAGKVTVESGQHQLVLRLESAGIVSSLFKINDTYTVNYDEPACAVSSEMDAIEGKRHHDTRVTYDRSRNHAYFLERDLLSNSVVRETGTDIPDCVSDTLGALVRLRTMKVEPGQSAQLPVSDGRRSASVKIEALEREEVKTPAGSFRAVRYQADLMNGVVYSRKGRLLVWLTADDRRLPVQIQLKMNFPVGTVTLQLEKEEHS